jgi:hypothetical protein
MRMRTPIYTASAKQMSGSAGARQIFFRGHPPSDFSPLNLRRVVGESPSSGARQTIELKCKLSLTESKKEKALLPYGGLSSCPISVEYCAPA